MLSQRECIEIEQERIKDEILKMRREREKQLEKLEEQLHTSRTTWVRGDKS